MATLVLSSLGGAIGSQLGSFGMMMGQLAGNILGSAIDQHIFPSETGHREGPRLQELAVQNSAYGHMIPIIYGTVRLAGNIIWASDIRETPHHHYIDYGGKNSAGQTHTQYSYSVSLAIAICEGEISRVNNIWADDQLLDGYNYQYRIYRGNEEQEPDPLIEATEGIAPAYRSLAYVVFENFPLTAFGNRLPTFSFEITRKVNTHNSNLLKPENLVQSINIIPGAGEFVYDTIAQYKQHVDNSGEYTVPRGNKICLNQHIDSQKTNSILAIEDLKYTLPKVTWVAPVVSWFASDTDIAKCYITPAVEFKESAMSFPDPWQVNNFNRRNAPKILYNNNQPIYGGTPSDAGVVRFLQHLKQTGYNIMFYPMLFVNQLHKPWRGRISGNSKDVADFFNNKEHGYNKFILHYAKLVGQYIDAFVIGSELIGLTGIRDNDSFPAVEQLCLLAAQVREILPNRVNITYAADWSEYHHTSGGWYNLDPLWAHPALDFIGIDAYFPLTANQQEAYDIDTIKHGWQSGEGYDFYYEDVQRKIKKPLSPAYAWKNIRWWWENEHINPDGQTSPWLPCLKKIWFTEYGFPSVDLASNQPNVFYSKDSVEGGLPYNSQGYSDVQAQRTAIVATEEYWQAQNDMVERLFLWTWDARPYPAWPSLSTIWADAYAWERGHWVQGKLDTVMLGEVCLDLCAKAGLPVDKFDLDFLGQSVVQGFFLNRQISLRNAISYLQQGYFFSIRENKGKLQFIDLKRELLSASIPTGQLVSNNYFARDHIDVMQIIQKAERILPQNIVLNYIDATSNYAASNAQAQIENVEANLQQTISLPIVTNPYHARQIAYINLHAKWYSRLAYSFMLPLSYLSLKPLDIIKLTDNLPKIRISKIFLGKNNTIEVRGYADEPRIYHYHSSIQHAKDNVTNNFTSSNIEILDISTLPFEQYSAAKGRIFIAACGESEGWLGCALKLTTSEDAPPIAQIKLKHPATMGKILKPAGESSPYLIDQKNKIIVNMQQGKLHSLPASLADKDYNLALIGNEIIQYKYARLLQEDQYELSELFRGLYGTEQYISSHAIGERFILLDQNLPQIELDNTYLGSNLFCYGSDSEQPIEFNYFGACLREYAPAHLTVYMQLDGSLLVSWVGRSKDADSWHQFGSNIKEVQYLLQLEYQNGEVEELWVDGTECILSPQQLIGLSSIAVAQISPQFGVGEKVSFKALF